MKKALAFRLWILRNALIITLSVTDVTDTSLSFSASKRATPVGAFGYSNIPAKRIGNATKRGLLIATAP